MSGFMCMECGKKFKTVRAAERATSVGCPKCGGVDIDLDYGAKCRCGRIYHGDTCPGCGDGELEAAARERAEG